MRRLIAAVLLVGGIPAPWASTAQAAPQSSCTDLGGTVETGRICHVHTSDSTYMLELRYPVDFPDQALADYVAQNRDGFVNVAQSTGPRDRPYEMDATAEQHGSGQPPNGTKTVVLKIFQDVGGPHPSMWYKSFNYDLGSGKPVTFDDLFAPDSKPLEAIYPIVQSELARQTGVPGAVVVPGAGLDPSHYQNFAITDDELIFYFAPGELLPLNIGISTARVPRGAIPPLTV